MWKREGHREVFRSTGEDEASQRARKGEGKRRRVRRSLEDRDSGRRTCTAVVSSGEWSRDVGGHLGCLVTGDLGKRRQGGGEPQ